MYRANSLKERVAKVFLISLCFIPALTVPVYADPVSNFLSNFFETAKGWLVTGASIYFLYGAFNFVQGIRQEDAMQKRSGMKHAISAIALIVISANADFFISWITGLSQ